MLSALVGWSLVVRLEVRQIIPNTYSNLVTTEQKWIQMATLVDGDTTRYKTYHLSGSKRNLVCMYVWLRAMTSSK